MSKYHIVVDYLDNGRKRKNIKSKLKNLVKSLNCHWHCMSLYDTIMSKKLNMIIIEQYLLPGFILSGDFGGWCISARIFKRKLLKLILY